MTDTREPLNNMDAEASVIGALLMDVSGIDKIAGVIVEADFFARENRAIFRAVTRLADDSKTVDTITVAEFLQEHGMLDQVGGLPGIGAMAMNVPSSANIRRYAEIVRDYALLRRVKSAADDIAELVYRRNGMEAREIVDAAQSKMMLLSEVTGKDGSGPQSIADVMMNVSRRIDELYELKGETDVTGLATGFRGLDKMTTGLHPGDLVILAGRPSMGKTAFALNIVENVGITQRKPVLVFSIEMISEQLGLRMMSSLSQIHAQRVRTGRIYDGEWSRITDALGKVQDAPIWIDEDSGITSAEMRSRSRRIHRECGGLSLIVIDYLQLMGSEGGEDNRAIELGKITRGLKRLGKELQCPVIVLSQLNRGLEARPNKRPIMSDLRDSGSIEQDADIVIFLYRDEVYNPDSLDVGLAEIIVGKQRNGPTGKVVVSFAGELTKFTDQEHNTPLPSSLARANKRSERGNFPRKNDNGDDDHVPM
jgi:replicative DNA helicase